MEPLVLGLRVLVSLAAVFGLMWLLHRRLRAGTPGLRAKVLSVVARQTVGPKASVVLVDTDGKRFLLGVTEHGISVLHTADVPEPVVPVVAAPALPAAGSGADADPDPDHDAVPGDSLPVTATRRSVRHAASFEAELRRQRAQSVGEPGRPARPGSILEPATWRLAAEALRSGRRP
ncbi:flagellar biosynthetic protein FliO [Intrasporangium sp. YIM S08009]|uniref:flagellar biosynthetic protein FliO n=1 Tax=Intrasporangium zincisolvens TaxID=3080018 RepID=UPI002B0522F0|nr:flagellar biosynthetic protein FliO [Intrasporangium sp. YIM S08009]